MMGKTNGLHLFSKWVFIYVLFLIFPITWVEVRLSAKDHESNASRLTPFEKAELKRLINLDFLLLSKVSIQEY